MTTPEIIALALVLLVGALALLYIVYHLVEFFECGLVFAYISRKGVKLLKDAKIRTRCLNSAHLGGISAIRHTDCCVYHRDYGEYLNVICAVSLANTLNSILNSVYFSTVF